MPGRAELGILVEQARGGSGAAWGKVYDATAPAVYRLCRRVLLTREDAEDATEEVFLKARLRLGHYDPGRPFAPWLFRVAANHCWDELRARRHRGRQEADEPDDELERLEDEGPTPQETVLANESRDRLREAIAGLDDRSRAAVVLRYFAELSYAEIAEVLGISTTFVGVLLLRARRRLRRRLETP